VIHNLHLLLLVVVDMVELDIVQLIQVVLEDQVVAEGPVDRNRAVVGLVVKVITAVQVVHQPLTVVAEVVEQVGLVKIQEPLLIRQVLEDQVHPVQSPVQQ
jgi:flagellar biosynthesis protein FliQ